MAALTTEIDRVSVRGWIGRVLLAGLGLWYALDLLRTLLSAVDASGAGGILEPVFTYRLGEALIVFGFALYLLARDRDPRTAQRARGAVWVGVILAGLSTLGLVGRMAWTALAPLVAVLGLAGLLLTRHALPATSRAARLSGWLILAGLILLHLVGYAVGFLFHGYVVEPFPSAFPIRAGTRDARWQQDVGYLGSQLARLHMNPFHTTPEETYWTLIDNLEDAIPHLTDAQISVEMMRIVAAVGDAHTNFSAGNSIPLIGLPLDLRWYSDGLFVRGISPEYPDALGARVVMIGALTADQAYQAVLPLISHENDSWARLNSSNYLNVSEVLVIIGAVDRVGPVPLVLENSQGDEFTVEIAPLPPGEKLDFLSAVEQQPYYRSQPDLPFWFDYRDATQTLYFRYAACIDPTGFRALMVDLWKTVDEQPVERLIVDLRGNGGGNTFQFEEYFASGLEAHPQLNQPDRFFVLIDRGTFSAASGNAVFLSKNTQAVFVGEPTGGKPNSYGEVRQFRLPNSLARVSYSTNYFQELESDPDSLEPDIRVDVTAQDAFAGRDPLLERIVPEEVWGE